MNREIKDVWRIHHCFYYTVSQLLAHLVPFVGDALLAYLLQKTILVYNNDNMG